MQGVKEKGDREGDAVQQRRKGDHVGMVGAGSWHERRRELQAPVNRNVRFATATSTAAPAYTLSPHTHASTCHAIASWQNQAIPQATVRTPMIPSA